MRFVSHEGDVLVLSTKPMIFQGITRSADAVRDFVVETFEACEPLNTWIVANIGRTTMEMPRRGR